MRANADRPSFQLEIRRRRSDRAFLATVRRLRDGGDIGELVGLEANLLRELCIADARGRAGPNWRLVAAQRAIAHVLRST